MNITKEVHSYTLHPSSVHSTRVHTSCIFAPNTCHQAKNPQHWGIMLSASRNLGTTPLQKDLFMLCDPFPYFVFIILIMNPTAYMFYKFDSVSLFMKFLCTVIHLSLLLIIRFLSGLFFSFFLNLLFPVTCSYL